MKLNVLGLATLIIIFEVLVRFAGLADVPLRTPNPVTGYIPNADQDGRFLLNDWTINNLGMISSNDYQLNNDNIVLAGDSIVFGGNPFAQKDRLGSILNGEEHPVYAIADGSWGLKNQLNYFNTMTEPLGRVKKIIFVLNSGDFSVPSLWSCESYHPTERPSIHFYFLFRKYFLPDCTATPNNVIVKDYLLNDGVSALLRNYPNTKLYFVLYPNKMQYMNEVILSEVLQLDRLIDGPLLDDITVLDLTSIFKDRKVWGGEYYQDDIHPTKEGVLILGAIIRELVLKDDGF